MIMPFDTFQIYNVFENIMENGTFAPSENIMENGAFAPRSENILENGALAPWSKCSIFLNIFKSIQSFA